MTSVADITPKLKAQLRLAINRLKLAQQKRAALSKLNRRNLIPLLEAGKVESARIRIENIIQEDIHVELLELLEVYCELLLARTSSIDATLSSDDRLRESVYSLIYAAPHADIKELLTVRAILSHMIAKEVYTDAIENLTQQVPHKIITKIHSGIPSDQLVTAYLTEIARAYNTTVPGIYEADVVDAGDASDGGAKDDPIKEEKEKKSEQSGAKSEAKSETSPSSQSSLPGSRAKSPLAPGSAGSTSSTKEKEEKEEKPASQDKSSEENDLWARFAALKK